MRNQISVCMATYNGALYIREQLISILKQLGPADEVIVSDDGSSDGTIGIVRELNDSRIHIHENNGNHGYTPNFMNALSFAKGDYIFLSDQDDIWEDNKVNRCVEELQTSIAVFHDAIVVDAKNNVINNSIKDIRPCYKSFWGNMYRMGHLGCCTAFRRELIIIALPFPPNYKLVSHDDWLVDLSCACGRISQIDDKLIKYRRHGNNSSNLTSNLTLWKKIVYRLYILCYVTIRRAKYLIAKNN